MPPGGHAGGNLSAVGPNGGGRGGHAAPTKSTTRKEEKRSTGWQCRGFVSVSVCMCVCVLSRLSRLRLGFHGGGFRRLVSCREYAQFSMTWAGCCGQLGQRSHPSRQSYYDGPGFPSRRRQSCCWLPNGSSPIRPGRQRGGAKRLTEREADGKHPAQTHRPSANGYRVAPRPQSRTHETVPPDCVYGVSLCCVE